MKIILVISASLFLGLCRGDDVSGDGNAVPIAEDKILNVESENTLPLSPSDFQKRTFNFHPFETLMEYFDSFRNTFADSYAEESQHSPINKNGKEAGRRSLLDMIRSFGKKEGSGGSYGYGPSRGKGNKKGGKSKGQNGFPNQAYGPPVQSYGVPSGVYGAPSSSHGPHHPESLPPPPIHLQQAHHQAEINTLSGGAQHGGGSYTGFSQHHVGGHSIQAALPVAEAYRSHDTFSVAPSPPSSSNSIVFTLPGGSASQSSYSAHSQGGSGVVSHFGSTGYSSTSAPSSIGLAHSSTPTTVVASTAGYGAPSVASLGGSGYASVTPQPASYSTPTLHLTHSSVATGYSSPSPVVSSTLRPSVAYYSTVAPSQGSSVSLPSSVYSSHFLDPFKIMSAPNLSSNGGKLTFVPGISSPTHSPKHFSTISPASPSPSNTVKQYQSLALPSPSFAASVSNGHSSYGTPAAAAYTAPVAAKTYVNAGKVSAAHASAAHASAAHASAAHATAAHATAAHATAASAHSLLTGHRAQAHSATYNSHTPVIQSQNIYLPSEGGTYILGSEDGYDDSDPIIEIVVQESNVTLPPPPPITIPHHHTEEHKQDPVQVYFVKYDGAEGINRDLHSHASASSSVSLQSSVPSIIDAVGGSKVAGYVNNGEASSHPKLNLDSSSTPGPHRITLAYAGGRPNRSPLPHNHKFTSEHERSFISNDLTTSSLKQDLNTQSSTGNILDVVKKQLDAKGGPYTASVQILNYPSSRPLPHAISSKSSPEYSSNVSNYSTPTHSINSRLNSTRTTGAKDSGDDKVVVITSVVQSESSSSAKVGPKYIDLKRTDASNPIKISSTRS